MKPTDDTIALAAWLGGGEWMAADEIRHAVSRLGFRMPSAQWISGRLRVQVAESCPRFEKRDTGLGYAEYRVTHWAETGLENAWRGFMRRASRRAVR